MQRYDPRTALIVVDVQNDFADPEGSLSVAGGEATIPVVNREAWAAIRAGAFVAYTQDWHPEHTPHFARDGGIWPVHCVGGAWGSALHPALEVVGPSLRKGANGEDGYSGFTMRDPVSGAEVPTELAALLAGPRDRAGRRLRPGHRLLREEHGPRRAAAGLRDLRAARCDRGGGSRPGRRRAGPRRAAGGRRATGTAGRVGRGLIVGRLLRLLIRIAPFIVTGAWLAERWLRDRSGDEAPAPIRTSIAINAPIERVWAVLSDIERQPEWMHDLKSVRLTTPPPVGVGTRAIGRVQVFGIAVEDPIEITAFEPPTRYAIRHEGLVSGGGDIRLVAGAATATRRRRS